jgi:Fic family protein
MINQQIADEITEKFVKLAYNPRYYDQRKNLVVQNLRTIGDVYSFWIENPALRKALLLEKSNEKKVRKMAKKGIEDVNNGWYYLGQIGTGKPGNFVNYLDEKILKKLNGIVYSEGEMPRDFRKKDVTLSIIGFTPCSWEKVPQKIKESLDKIKKLYKEDPLECAIRAHLDIAAIQPFMDGNKRCARLLQDRILLDAGMPPAIITAGEGTFYHDLLVRTLLSYDEDENGQKQFYDYCASKVNNGLDEILGDLVEEPYIVNNH